jgi:hypothetical protein
MSFRHIWLFYREKSREEGPKLEMAPGKVAENVEEKSNKSAFTKNS